MYYPDIVRFFETKLQQVKTYTISVREAKDESIGCNRISDDIHRVNRRGTSGKWKRTYNQTSCLVFSIDLALLVIFFEIVSLMHVLEWMGRSCLCKIKSKLAVRSLPPR
jgi:hypothetical protein